MLITRSFAVTVQPILNRHLPLPEGLYCLGGRCHHHKIKVCTLQYCNSVSHNRLVVIALAVSGSLADSPVDGLQLTFLINETP